ncbi:MAG: hypothetical protein ACYDB3_04835 [Acidimicrobiales bacterium]
MSRTCGFEPNAVGEAASNNVTAESLGRKATGLLGQALASDDAEAAGLRADDVLSDPEQAVVLLGAPDAWHTARHAVVQRYGRVGALLVVGYEDRWRRRQGVTAAPASETTEPEAFEAISAGTAAERIDELIEHFGELDAHGMEALLEALDRAEGRPVEGEAVEARRWLHATYAVAERDGTEMAHRAYMRALDRVMRLATPLIAS